jgi:hypothetical protein
MGKIFIGQQVNSLREAKMEMWWILIAAAAFLVLFIIAKFRHGHHKFSNFLMIFGVAFLLIGAYLVYAYITEPAKVTDFAKSMKVYMVWVVQAGKNIGRITGYAVHQNWSLQVANNSTAP